MNQRVQALLKARFGKVKAVSGGSYRIPCPTCDPTHSKKMKRYLSPGWTTSRCFICEKTIPINELLDDTSEFEQSAGDFEEPAYPYATIAPYTYPSTLASLPSDSAVIQFLKKDHLTNLEYYDQLGVRYISQDCGVPIKFDSGFAVDTSEALFFPIFGKNREYAGWQIRFIPNTKNGDKFQFMRYMHLFPKGEHLFNYHTAKQYDSVIVVEGAKKALKLANSVATLGKGISDKQKQLIQEWKNVILVLDSEEGAQRLALDIQREFRMNGRRCFNIDLGKYGFASPDEATTEELQAIIQKEILL
jgi:DNA primase